MIVRSAPATILRHTLRTRTLYDEFVASSGNDDTTGVGGLMLLLKQRAMVSIVSATLLRHTGTAAVCSCIELCFAVF